MSTPAPDPKRAKFPLAVQAEETNKLLSDRYRKCEARVKSGDMSRDDADRAIAIVRAIRDTFLLFAEFEDEIRATLQHCLRQKEIAAEVAELRKNPAVQSMLAIVGEDADVGLPSADEPSDEPPLFNPDAEESA